MALKKSELYSKLWKSCDALRGGMDASQYKDYVLVLLFVKYVSDKYAGRKDTLIQVPKGGGFKDLEALIGDKEIGDKINTVIKKLANANDLQGVIDVADFNDDQKLGKGKDMVDRLSKLVAIFQDLDFAKNRADGDDLLGDAYEYLMRHFATESGKSKGQFYTPAEVSSVMAKVIGVANAKSADQTIYDPTCGSGSLLLKAHDETPLDLTIYGQEMDNATKALAKMNMILHDCPTADIQRENTISTPLFVDKGGSLKTFDYLVANPPFSWKAWRNGFDPEQDPFARFEYGVPPKTKGDYAFLLHLLKSMKSTGVGAIVLPHGVLFRGDAEGAIRKKLIKQGYIKGVIGLPPNLFYGTSIAACILVVDKAGAGKRRGIFMIDASKGFIKDGNKNRLRSQDIHRIVDCFNNQIEIPKYSRLVPFEEIEDEKNGFNLNIPRYIDSSEPEDLQDISAHLLGGIPNRDIENLAAFWKVMPGLKSKLFKSANRQGYSELSIEPSEIRGAILNSDEFLKFKKQVTETFESWKKENAILFKNLKAGEQPKKFIFEISESLLKKFKPLPLLDPYAVYQQLMDYWAETMQDDVYMVSTIGWSAMNEAKPNVELIPEELVIEAYFASDAENIETKEAESSSFKEELEQMVEEHGADEGHLSEVVNEKGNVTKAAIKVRLKEIKNDADFKEELELIESYQALMEKEAAAKKAVKILQKELSKKVDKKYQELKESEIRNLVVENKWLSEINLRIDSEVDRISRNFSGRIKTLAERYEAPLPKISSDVESLSKKVEDHLGRMGFSWVR